MIVRLFQSVVGIACLSETDCGHGEDVLVGLLLEERDRHAAAEHIFSATRYN